MLRGVVWLVCAIAIAACSSGMSAPKFALRDDSGNLWRLWQQRGKVVLLTFGFTHCRDACPLALAKLARLARRMHSSSRSVEVVFVTVDPRRGTVPVLHLIDSRGRIRGVRDDDNSIASLARAIGEMSPS
jgi:protein SCO1